MRMVRPAGLESPRPDGRPHKESAGSNLQARETGAPGRTRTPAAGRPSTQRISRFEFASPRNWCARQDSNPRGRTAVHTKNQQVRICKPAKLVRPAGLEPPRPDGPPHKESAGSNLQARETGAPGRTRTPAAGRPPTQRISRFEFASPRNWCARQDSNPRGRTAPHTKNQQVRICKPAKLVRPAGLEPPRPDG